MRQRFFFPVLIAVMLGCGLGSHFFAFFDSGRVGVFVTACVSSVLMIGLLMVRHRVARLCVGVCAVIAVCSFSLFYGMERQRTARDPELLQHAGQSIELIGTVVSDPQTKGTRQRFTLQAQRLVGTEQLRVKDKVTVSLPAFPRIAYGDIVRIRSRLEIPEAFDTEYGRTFPYDEYLYSQGIGYTMYAQTATRLGGTTITSSTSPDDAPLCLSSKIACVFQKIVQVLFRIKHALFLSIERVMHEPFGSIARAMVFGDQSGISSELSQQFQTTGLIHIMVLSGSNITVIAIALLALFRRLGKRLGIVISAVAILGFLLMTGLTPTSLRAGIMGGIGLVALSASRRSHPLRALCLAGAVMAIINPLVIFESVSFQLSFVATLGLILFTPLFTFVHITERFGLREIVATTLATQCATLPLLIGKIGMVSVIGLAVNILVVPLVPYIMLLTVIVSVLGLIPHIFSLFGYADVSSVLALVASGVSVVPESILRIVVMIVAIGSRVHVLSFAQVSSLVGWCIGVAVSGLTALILFLAKRKRDSY